ncbi:sensor histidine kinase [filamentous cyanobacterium LEGE 11480]|uniref:histidine kinase n=1 Tax=Romeriopsis navalis LEGE 11480 TaxID=2777977 RepID=A0A928Z2N1_9CYAN|nr:ATP-binding protein [Romeriopsis navalis]MBE9028308.1 sensor histidine kinase [Romeriopsis navalis LEGE 11480]
MQQSRHRLLQRQLKRYVKDLDAIPPEWQQLLSAVDAAYNQADDDRARMERTLELSSQELLAANTDLQQVLASVEQQVAERTVDLTVANDELAETLQQLQQTQLQLVQVEKMSSLGQLVAGVAHELNNPVTFIHGNLRYVTEYIGDLLQVLRQYEQAYPEPVSAVQAAMADVDFAFITADIPRVVSSIAVGAERIDKIVQALRTFSRLDEATVKRVAIDDCLESTLMVLQGNLKLSGGGMIGLQRVYGELPEVECYASHLNQVFLNILTNAIDALHQAPKFTGAPECVEDLVVVAGGLSQADWDVLKVHPQPVIQVRTQVTDGGDLEVQILDNADGIPTAIRDRIFDPFFTTKAVGDGTGLGLSTAYQVITNLHGGSLTCRSTPGFGTAFVIRIPLSQDGQILR